MKKFLFALGVLIGFNLFVFAQYAYAAPITTFSNNLLPNLNDTYDLGSTTPALEWLHGYFNTVCIQGDCRTVWPSGSGGGTFSWTPHTWGNSTSTTLGFLNGFLSTASSTINSNLFLTNLSGGFAYIGTNGLVTSAASSSLFGYTPLNPTRQILTTYPVQGGGDLSADRTLSLAFGTSTSNTWGGTQTFTNALTDAALNGLIGGNNGVTYAVSTSSLNASITGSSGSVANALTISSPLTGSSYNGSAGVSIGCQTASGSQAGCLSSTDWTTFNNKGSGTVTSVTGTWPIVSSGGTTPAISYSGFGTTSDSGIGHNLMLYTSNSGVVIGAATSTLNIGGNAGTATKLATARTIAITGDLSYTSPSFDGSANVTAIGTLATVNSNVGTFTYPSVTVNGKGLVTAISNGTAPTTYTGTYPIQVSGSVISSGFGTTSDNGIGNNVFLYNSNGGVMQGAASSSLDLPNTALQHSTISGVALGSNLSTLTINSPLTGSSYNGSGGVSIGCTTASSGVTGCLSGTDWNTFNNKIGWGQATSTSANQIVYTDALGKLTSVASSSLDLPNAALQNSSLTINTNNGITGGASVSLGGTLSSIGLATINAGVLGAQANGSVPTSQATSTLFGTGTGGQVLMWSNATNGLVFAATSTAGGGSGTVTSVGLGTPNSSLSITGTNPVTTSGTINADLNLAHSNWWTALQNFTLASTSQFTATSSAYFATVSGSVGVGTTSPAKLFSVGGSELLNGSLYIDGAASSITNSILFGGGSAGDFSFTAGGSFNGDFGYNNFSNSRMFFSTGNGSVTERLTIQQGGNIGIASTSPFAKFSIGTGTASSSLLIAEYRYGFNGNEATSTSKVLDCRTSNTVHWPLGNAATTLTLGGMSPGSNCTVIVENPAATAGAITWAVPSGSILLWPAGTAPTQTTTANATDVWSFKATQGSSTVEILGAQTANFH